MVRKRQKTSNENLIKDIKSVSKKIGRIPRQKDYKEHGSFALNTLLNRKPWNLWLTEIFGTTNKRKEKQGNPVTDLEFLSDIKKVYDMLGKIPTQRDYSRHGSYALTSLLRRKRWNQWLEASLGKGMVNYNRSSLAQGKRIPDHKLMNDVRAITKKLGHPPSRGEYKHSGIYSSDTIVSRMPWDDFVFKAVGKRPSPVMTSRAKVSEEDLLDNLSDIYRKLGRTPVRDDCDKGKYSYVVYRRCFGTFGNALVAAGMINPLNRYCIPRNELIGEIQRVYGILKHTPSIEEFLDHSPIMSIGPIYFEFGSWTRALLASSIPVEKARNVTKKHVSEALDEWFEQNNRDISCMEYWQIRKARARREFPYSPSTVKEKLGKKTWAECIRSCGFDYESRDIFQFRQSVIGKDGRKYKSRIEADVAYELLSLWRKNQIVSYEYEARVLPERQWTCDFLIKTNNGNIWLEVDGLRCNRKHPYDSGNNEKIEYYKKSGKQWGVISYDSKDIAFATRKIVLGTADRETH